MIILAKCKERLTECDRWSPRSSRAYGTTHFIGRRWSRKRKPNWVSSPWVSDVVRRCRRYLRVWASWYELRVCRITRRGLRRGHGGPPVPRLRTIYTASETTNAGIYRWHPLPLYLLCCTSDWSIIRIRGAWQWIYHTLSDTVFYCNRTSLMSLDVLAVAISNLSQD